MNMVDYPVEDILDLPDEKTPPPDEGDAGTLEGLPEDEDA